MWIDKEHQGDAGGETTSKADAGDELGCCANPHAVKHGERRENDEDDVEDVHLVADGRGVQRSATQRSATQRSATQRSATQRSDIEVPIAQQRHIGNTSKLQLACCNVATVEKRARERDLGSGVCYDVERFKKRPSCRHGVFEDDRPHAGAQLSSFDAAAAPVSFFRLAD